MTMISAARLATPVRFGSTSSSNNDLADKVIQTMGQRRSVAEYLRQFKLLPAQPKSFPQPVMSLIQGPRRMDFLNALAGQFPTRPLIYFDVTAMNDKLEGTTDFNRNLKKDTAIQDLFLSQVGFQGQPSVRMLVDEGEQPIILIKNIEGLSDKAKADLRSLTSYTGTCYMAGAGVRLNLDSVPVFCTISDPKALQKDQALIARIPHRLEV